MSEPDSRKRTRRRRAFLGSLAAGLAHEIKNPLSAMSINLQMLREDLDSADPRDRRFVRRVDLLEKEVARLDQILSDFLRFARGFSLSLESRAINPLLRDIVELWAEGAKSVGIEVELVLGSDLPEVKVDPTYFHQAILNLLINAQEAIAGRGDPKVQSSGQIVLGSRLSRTGGVEVLVIDDGPGMVPEVRSRIFEPYFSTKGTGSGLGLATSRRIIEEHSGSLSVESDEGRGTRFCVRLPAVSTEDPTETHKVRDAEAQAGERLAPTEVAPAEENVDSEQDTSI